MVNISEFINALKISWLRRVIQSSENQEWYSLSKVDFHKLLSYRSGYSIDLSKNLSNPFWKDCLNSWAKFCNVCKVESVKQILCSPLWFNNNLIRGPNSYINNWFKKGIKQISWERSGSVVECLTRDQRAAGSSLTGVTALWSLSKTHLS